MRYPHNLKLFLSNHLCKNKKRKASPPPPATTAGSKSCFCRRSADSLAKTAAATSTTTQDSNQKEIKKPHHHNLWIPENQHTSLRSDQATQLPTPHVENVPYDCVGDPPRIRLQDGRYLAYVEQGVPRDKAKYKIIIVHGFGSSKEMNFLAPREMIEELGIYFLMYDRAGYGESDPNPRRSVKSEALDIQELADQLEMGSKFYVIGVSMGSYPIWSCLKYIPRRLAGASLIVPVVNYRWPSLPKTLIKDDYRRRLVRLTFWFSKYAPGLLQWWVTQKWIPSTSVLEKNPVFFNTHDIEILRKIPGFPMLTQDGLQDRDIFDTLRHDFMASFGDWEFDPTDLSNPFSENESSVHIWQGYEDRVVPFQLQRFISKKLPWISYHEVPEGGHLIVHYNGLCEAVLRALLLKEEPLTLDQIRP